MRNLTGIVVFFTKDPVNEPVLQGVLKLDIPDNVIDK
jgi:hypothetical protein